MPTALPDEATCRTAVRSKDARFDGWFVLAVTSTGIYCRPSCPARTPAWQNVTFHPSAASAQGAGYRACKRCLPDATPGSPDWDVVATAVRHTLASLSERHPGHSVEVRVPPHGAIQCVEGVRHRRGTPPNVVETDATTWLSLVTHRITWTEALDSGALSASGNNADISALL